MNDLPYAKFFNIDRARNKFIEIKLEDSNGDEIKVDDLIDQIDNYLTEQFSSKEINVCTQQVYPLFTEILTKSISRTFKDPLAGLSAISQAEIRAAFLQEMVFSFYIMKFIQKNNIKIVSIETDANKEDIEKIMKQDHISASIITAKMAGLSSEEICKTIIKTGAMTIDELVNSKFFSEQEIKKWTSKQ